MFETLVTPLVNHVDFLPRNTEEVHHVALGRLADGDDAVGTAAGAAELERINPAVDGLVIGREAQEYQVVNRHHRPNAPLAEARGQFAAQAVEERRVGRQFAAQAERAPQRLEGAVQRLARIAEGELRDAVEPPAQLVASRVGRIEVVAVLRRKAGQHGDHRPAVVAQTRSVVGDALGVECDAEASESRFMTE